MTKLQGGRDLGATTLAQAVEGALIDLTGSGIVDNITALHVAIVTLEPRIDPEGRDPYQPLLAITHRARNVHHVDNHGISVR